MSGNGLQSRHGHAHDVFCFPSPEGPNYNFPLNRTIIIMFNNLYNYICEDGFHVDNLNDTSRCRGFLYRLM